MEYIISERYILENPQCLSEIKNISYELIDKLINANNKNIKYIPIEYLTYDLIKNAMIKYPYAIKYATEQTEELQYLYIEYFKKNINIGGYYFGENNEFIFELLQNPSHDVCKMAIDIIPLTIQKIKYNIELRLYAIQKDPKVAFFLKDISDSELDYLCDVNEGYNLLRKNLSFDQVENIVTRNREWSAKNFECFRENNYFKLVMCKLDPTILEIVNPNVEFCENLIKIFPEIEQYLDKYIETSKKYQINISNDVKDNHKYVHKYNMLDEILLKSTRAWERNKKHDIDL